MIKEIVFGTYPEKAHAFSLPAEDMLHAASAENYRREDIASTDVQDGLTVKFPLELSPSRFTRPSKSSLAIWDIRVKRLTSPFTDLCSYCLPLLTSPRRPDRVTRGTQCQLAVVSWGVQTDDVWENTSNAEVQSEHCTTTPTHDKQSHPPARMSPTSRWEPRRLTIARPCLEWRERL